jgi:hypothetical protein
LEGGILVTKLAGLAGGYTDTARGQEAGKYGPAGMEWAGGERGGAGSWQIAVTFGTHVLECGILVTKLAGLGKEKGQKGRIHGHSRWASGAKQGMN